MNIKEVAKITGLTDHTLRYYEKKGLLKNIKRNSIGYRDYKDNDVVWLEFLERLKATGMSIKGMLTFAKLRYQGDDTVKERLAILEDHKKAIENNINKFLSNLKKIMKK